MSDINIVQEPQSFFQNRNVVIGLCIAIILYSSFLADHVPESLVNLMDSCVGKGISLVVVAYISYKQPLVGILMVAAYIFTIQKINTSSKKVAKKVTFKDPVIEETVISDVAPVEEPVEQVVQVVPEEHVEEVAPPQRTPPTPIPMSMSSSSELVGSPL